MHKFEIHASLKIQILVSETILSTTICPLSVPRLFKLSEKYKIKNKGLQHVYAPSTCNETKIKIPKV